MGAAAPGRRAEPPHSPAGVAPLVEPIRAQRKLTRLRIVAKILYWLAVIVISLALLVALVLFFESRDDSNLGRAGDSAVLGAPPGS